jgi:hypothetical protein
MRCIFCLKERSPSVEHVFPEAIGGRLKIDRVCKPCNEWLGAKVDVLLTDDDFVILKRAELEMQHRAGNPVDPWAKVFRNGTLANDPDQRVQIVRDPVTGQLQPKLMYKSVRTKLDDGSENVRITLDASDGDKIGKIIQRERRRAKMDPLSEHEIAALVAAAKRQMGSIERPEVLHKPVVNLSNYQRGISKIIYELAWLWLGDDYLADPAAEQLRNVILRGSEERIKPTIVLSRHALIGQR